MHLKVLLRQILPGVLPAVLLALQVIPALAADYTMQCNSSDMKYNDCRVRAQGGFQVSLARQTSRTRCVQGTNWGKSNSGVWVDKGCSGIFKISQNGWSGNGRNGWNNGNRNDWSETPRIMTGRNGEAQAVFKNNNCVVYYNARGKRINNLPVCRTRQLSEADNAFRDYQHNGQSGNRHQWEQHPGNNRW